MSTMSPPETELACCRYWRERGAKTCVGCDASRAAGRGDIWRTHAQVARAVQRCGA